MRNVSSLLDESVVYKNGCTLTVEGDDYEKFAATISLVDKDEVCLFYKEVRSKHFEDFEDLVESARISAIEKIADEIF